MGIDYGLYKYDDTTNSDTSNSDTSNSVTRESKEQELGLGKFIVIPAGEFMMGSNNGKENEKPVHKVVISLGFEMGQTEVTQGQWEGVMGSNPSKFKGKNLPVETIDWNKVQEFIKKVNESSKKYFYRLPTEAEWEYAARAGTTGDYAGNLDEMAWYGYGAWYEDRSKSSTHPVRKKKANPWGLYDMHGNVFEWCSDRQGSYPSETVTDPSGTSLGLRVLRGGSWNRPADYCRSASRLSLTDVHRQDDFGFRLVRTSR